MKNKLNLIPLGILVALATAQTCLAAKELKSGSFAVVKSKVEHTPVSYTHLTLPTKRIV